MSGRGKGGAELPSLDFPGFAREFLRRNPAYCLHYHEIAAAMLRHPAGVQDELIRRWGLAYPLSPDASAGAEPALWAPEASVYTIILEEKRGGECAAPLVNADWPDVLVDRMLSGGRYLVIADKDGPHHVWLRAGRAAASLAYVIPRDAAAELRFEAARRLERRLIGAPPIRALAGHRPSRFQRHRLHQLLAIIDAFDRWATTYEIAREIVYPAMTIGRGAEWKSSSERRHTQRLIDEARELVNGGYRRLLLGRAGGATKTPPLK